MAIALAGSAVLGTLVMWAAGTASDRKLARDRHASRSSRRPRIRCRYKRADRNIAISPDGQHIVYAGGPQEQLVVRSIDRLDTHTLEGTADARYPFFSPDGQWVGFFDGASAEEGVDRRRAADHDLPKPDTARRELGR